MINNYTKAKIFPPPVKKKYSRTHLMLLIMIYHLKAILSIKDIGVLFHVALAEPDAEKQAQQIERFTAALLHCRKAPMLILPIWRKIRQMTPSMGRILCLAARHREATADSSGSGTCHSREYGKAAGRACAGCLFLSNFQKKKAVYEMLRRLLFLLPLFYFFYLSEQTKLIRFGNPVQNTVFLEQINQRASQRGALLQFLKCIEFTVLSPFHNALRRIHA